MDRTHHQGQATHRGIEQSTNEREQAQPENLTILVVEDNLINQKVVLALLKKNGYQADVALNGVEALVALQKKNYNLILMDINMPEMDGVEATQHIRSQWPSNEQPHIIAVTANAMTGDREKFLDAGMDDYVSKPIRPPLLTEAIDRALAKMMLGSPSSIEH